MRKFLIIGLLMITKLSAQVTFDNKFYRLDIPKNTHIEIFKSTNEEEANVDVYKLITEGKPKYLLYLMSNKLNADVDSVTIDNCKEFLHDIGNLEITDVKTLANLIKIDFLYTENKKVVCTVYLSKTNNILNRFLFIFPNNNISTKFDNEINILLNSIVYKVKYW